MKHLVAVPLIAVALSLSGCDNTEEVPVQETQTEPGVAVIADDAYPVGQPLNAQQQANFDAMDRDAVAEEYGTILVAATPAENPQMNSGMGTSDPSNADATATPDAMNSNAGSGGAPMPRSQMDFTYLDRNNDGKLSVAEYAIWAARVDPTDPKANDQKRPYLSPEQINEAGTTFFYFDDDGDTFLSPSEFDQARASARTP
ncbi:EF-hand domain-containing protein [Novosphingobium aquimarinum]|uniref:hypothetical protein n=1 Tax=Novosphingobium aquimarinum TaxID=2682494 RepID=UPI0012EB50EA|nr:hypothetical protein [Novosphingobium aquimarinum]